MTATAPAPHLLEDVLVGPPPTAQSDIRLEPVAKRVRAFAGGVAVAGSTRVTLMLESSRLPVYYFPIEDVRMELLSVSSTLVGSAHKGDASYYSIAVDGRVVEDAAWR